MCIIMQCPAMLSHKGIPFYKTFKYSSILCRQKHNIEEKFFPPTDKNITLLKLPTESFISDFSANLWETCFVQISKHNFLSSVKLIVLIGERICSLQAFEFHEESPRLR